MIDFYKQILNEKNKQLDAKQIKMINQFIGDLEAGKNLSTDILNQLGSISES